ncbi:YfcZ/YiiS family protein [Vibrio sp. AK197]|uniref:YfcZ/YiiS family protein n=1 Tax=Vibrio olivae TaxID=1243002 RepID=A0ABV5HQL4_9VIBR
MSDQVENDVCEACGCAGEMGFIIKEGDDVAEVSIFGPTQELRNTELEKYIALAKQVCANVEYETTQPSDDSEQLNARFKFEVSAEKLIFELKTRSISR